jgi:hypothetical protein
MTAERSELIQTLWVEFETIHDGIKQLRATSSSDSPAISELNEQRNSCFEKLAKLLAEYDLILTLLPIADLPTTETEPRP